MVLPKELPKEFDVIRLLDEEENWIERTSILTKQDHQDYIRAATEILEDLVNSLPLDSL